MLKSLLRRWARRSAARSPSALPHLSRRALLAGVVSTATLAPAQARMLFDPNGTGKLGMPGLRHGLASSVTLLAAPAGLGYTPGFNIWRNADGTYGHDYDPASTLPTPTTIIYVDASATDNSGDGLSWATRVRSLSRAVTLANAIGTSANAASGATVVGLYARPGKYRFRNKDGNGLADALAGTAFTRDLVIRPCDASGNPLSLSDTTSRIQSIQEETVTWAATSDANIYVASYDNSTTYGGRCFWDEKFADPDYPTYPMDLRSVGQSSLAAVADLANPWPEINAMWTKYGRGACFNDETNKKLYVRTKDNRAPDSQLCVGRALGGTNQARNLYLAPAASRNLRIWAANCDFFGGSPLRTYLYSGNGGAKQTIYAKDCGFCFGDDDNVHLDGPGFAVLLRCLSIGAWKDGYNYQQASLQDSASVFVELDCRSDWCGNSRPAGDASNNGSSAHNTVKMVRVNGTHRRVADRSIHDIMDVKSWNVGVSCIDHRRAGTDPTTAPGRACAHFIAGYDSLTAGTVQTAEMWLDGCVSTGANFDIGTQTSVSSGASGGKLHYRNMRAGLVPDASTTVAQTGTITTF